MDLKSDTINLIADDTIELNRTYSNHKLTIDKDKGLLTGTWKYRGRIITSGLAVVHKAHVTGDSTRTWITSENDYGINIGSEEYNNDLRGTWFTKGSVINGSDSRMKNSISSFNETHEVLFNELMPVTYKYNEGKSNRVHFGYIAQDVLLAMKKANLNTLDVAAVC
jgi:hypothetical protein